MPAEHTSPTSLGGISPGYRSAVDYNSGNLKGAFVPTSSPYDVSSGTRSQTSAMIGDGGELPNDPLLVGSIDSVDNIQVIIRALLD